MKKTLLATVFAAIFGVSAIGQADELAITLGVYNPTFQTAAGVNNTYKNGYEIDAVYGMYDINQYANIFATAGYANAKNQAGAPAGKLIDWHAGLGAQFAGNITSHVLINLAGSFEFHSLKDKAIGATFSTTAFSPAIRAGIDYALSEDKAVGFFYKKVLAKKVESSSYGIALKALF